MSLGDGEPLVEFEPLMKKGACVICSKSARLTRDHVPPKGTVPPDPIVVKRLEEHIAAATTKPMPPPS